MESSSSEILPGADERQAVLDVCLQLLSSLKKPGAAGRDLFLATLAPKGTACHARNMLGGGFQHEAFPHEFADRIPWESITENELLEDLDGEQTVLIDHDLAMAWVPFSFTRNGTITHVGTAVYTLIKNAWDPEEPQKVEWKICGMTDTGRRPSEEDRKRLGKEGGSW
ncbi:conserved hypothetical protein [Paecilomyces variotii No. 5]|uniref:SnoaL-like domain-containing protein n=1 Tax=Byssochlamys spectabilis (strain No. 5 / NBRC 109023) TaxID=1356009 RepID=V5FZZ8_BYSSN|nr:conserved hypothetical protein [Paecilomyces variotii No. 5]